MLTSTLGAFVKKLKRKKNIAKIILDHKKKSWIIQFYASK